MANGAPSTRASRDANWDRAHSDINVLAQRVTGLENAISGVNVSVGELGKKLDGKPTNWFAFIGSAVGILALTGGFLAQGKAPIDDSLGRHDREIGRITETAVLKDDFRQFEQQSSAWNTRLADRIRLDEDNSVTQRQLAEMKERIDERYRITTDFLGGGIQDAKKRIDSVDGDLIKRPEINSMKDSLDGKIGALTGALDGRINALSSRLNEIQHDFGSTYTSGDDLKSIHNTLDRLQMQINSMPAPITLTPAKPPGS